MIQYPAARGRKRMAAAFAALLGALAFSPPASAQIGSSRYAAVAIDARDGTVLSAANPDEPRYPASLTKIMTLYMLFDALREGRLTLDTRLVMSAEAASRPPTKLGLPPGAGLSVEGAILALVTKSANDVASLIGETLAGTEERFAQMMTLRARALGMSQTTFRNASGLPDIDQITTARDMATLGRRLFADHPDRYHYFSTVHARVGSIPVRNHNRMIGEYEGVDGIKTGYTIASGFNIVTSARRANQRVIAAVFGGSSWVERDRHAAMLLDDGFARLGVAPAAPAVAGLPLALAAPGAVAAARIAPRLLARAEAATIRRAAEPAPTAARTAAARLPARMGARPEARTEARAAARTAARPVLVRGQAAARPARVVEQGDGGRLVRTSARRPAETAAPRRAATPVAAANPPRTAAPVRRR